jgi:cleavage stimulation factor subunit 3
VPQSAKVVRPETSQMVIYDPRQMKGICKSKNKSIIPVMNTQLSRLLSSSLIIDLPGSDFSGGTGGYTKEVDEILKMLTPSTMSFVKNLPAIEGTPSSLILHNMKKTQGLLMISLKFMPKVN